jgi:hypothetical protein
MSQETYKNTPEGSANLAGLTPRPDRLCSFIDTTAEAAYFALTREWDERANSLHNSPEQTPTPTNGELGLHYQKISLYHGGATAGITDFLPAEDSTIGDGLYVTSMPDQAFGYAVERADERKKIGGDVVVDGTSPVVYEVELTDATFLDLRNPENTATILRDYAGHLEAWSAARRTGDLSWLEEDYLNIVAEKIGIIRGSKGQAPPHLKEVLQQTGAIFTEFVTGLGYDGVIAHEGGEGGYTGEHDSWVILDPSKARVTHEVTFATPYVFDQDAWRARSSAAAKLLKRSWGASAETVIQPEIEGLRIVDKIDPSRLKSLVSTAGRVLWVKPGEPVPDELATVEALVQDTAQSHPSEPINVSVTKTDFDPDMEDPFSAEALALLTSEDYDGPAHQDIESLYTRLVCDDDYSTIFYPTGPDGQPDLSQGWQPQPGEVVEFTNKVWHSPPLKVTRKGSRTLLTLRIGINALDL